MAPRHKQHKHPNHPEKPVEQLPREFKPTLLLPQPRDGPIPASQKVGRDQTFTFTPTFTRYQPLDEDGKPIPLEQFSRINPDGTTKSKAWLGIPDMYKPRDEPECWDDLSFVQDALVQEAARNDDILQLVAQINRVAKEALDYHNIARVPGAGQLPESLALIKKCHAMGDPDWHERGVSYYTANKICQALYDATEQPSWLREGADYGEWGIKWLKDRNNTIPEDIYVRCLIARTEYLATTYKCLWACHDGSVTREERMNFLQGALTMQGQSADWTCGVLCNGAEGWFLRDPAELKRWGCTRVIEFNKLMLLLEEFADVREDWKGRKVLGIVIEGTEKRPCVANGDAEERLYYVFLTYLYCRRWLTTREQQHYQEFITYARTWMKKREADPDADADTSSPLEAPNDRAILTAFHIPFASFDQETSSDITTHRLFVAYSNHLLALYTPITTPRHNPFLDNLLSTAYTSSQQIYNITKRIPDGLLVDTWSTRDTLFLNYPRVIDILSSNSPQSHPLGPDEDVLALVQAYPRPFLLSCSMTSIVNGQGFNVFTNWASGDILNDRLKFLRREEDGELSERGDHVEVMCACLTTDRWIRERDEEDGGFLLGGAVAGRDDDVIQFVERFRVVETAQAAGQQAQRGEPQPHPEWNFDG